jgi:hypothetical protein
MNAGLSTAMSGPSRPNRFRSRIRRAPDHRQLWASRWWLGTPQTAQRVSQLLASARRPLTIGHTSTAARRSSGPVADAQLAMRSGRCPGLSDPQAGECRAHEMDFSPSSGLVRRVRITTSGRRSEHFDLP